jgi:hypothetical protein
MQHRDPRRPVQAGVSFENAPSAATRSPKTKLHNGERHNPRRPCNDRITDVERCLPFVGDQDHQSQENDAEEQRADPQHEACVSFEIPAHNRVQCPNEERKAEYPLHQKAQPCEWQRLAHEGTR